MGNFLSAIKNCFESINFRSECMSDCFCCIKDSEIDVDIDVEKNKHHKHHKHHKKEDEKNNNINNNNT